jgi:glycosyltransferase involved in cell wall biosynthesis
MPKVDIVVPCYNYGRFLTVCVKSVLEQSVRDIRVLIIDDASTDNSLIVAKKLARDDPRVSVVAHSQNKGHIETYNEGIAWASADYFLLLSADDLLVAGALQRATQIMDENADVVLTYGDCIAWHDDRPFPIVKQEHDYTWNRHDLILEMCRTAVNFVPTPTAIGRTKTQQAVGGYRSSLPHAGDLEMWLRYAAHGSVAQISAVQAIYRKHTTAMSNSYYKRMLSDYRQRQQAFDSFFDEYHARLADSADLRRAATQTLAKRMFRNGIGVLRRGHIVEGLQLVRAAATIGYQLIRVSAFRKPPTITKSAVHDGHHQTCRQAETHHEA